MFYSITISKSIGNLKINVIFVAFATIQQLVPRISKRYNIWLLEQSGTWTMCEFSKSHWHRIIELFVALKSKSFLGRFA